DPQRFSKIQFATLPGGAVFLDALGGHHAGDRQT
ncbi:acetyltransferase, partial [Klebsiella pneumoniae]